MHIGVLCDPASFHTKKWAAALQRHGARVTIFSFSEETFEEVPCVRIDPPGGSLSYAAFLRGGPALRKALSAHRIDLLNPINITPFGVWAARSRFRPIAAVAMGSDILEYVPEHRRLRVLWDDSELPDWKQRLKSRMKRPFFRREVKKALDAAAFVTGDNQVLVDAIVQHFDQSREKVYLNRWGVEPDLLKPNPDHQNRLRRYFGLTPGRKLVLSPRGVKPIYQGEIIFKSFEKLVPRYPDTHFLLLSAGYDVPVDLQLRAKALHEQHQNFFFEPGLFPRKDLLQLYTLTDVMVSAPIYDGYSNALAEARYAGAIPVVNDTAATREIIRHEENGWVVDPFTPVALANSLEYVLENLATLRPKFAGPNRRWIEQHSVLDENIERFLDRCQSAYAATI